ncbi:hypothetical protein NONI108955_11145 [Nocardia ninae]|uniref:Uncharacterized protein n=1 Tax=Nocardia ninae NBRC 108245 TaxID=1210091 RepID=A0A511MMU4_9NOCA|nr:hypothetical protein [Nocardia ninae]GEM41944.1 hypothetical protein NN4_64630 [Nocardia ninae NBRC 108245]
MRLADLSWSSSELGRLAAELRHAGYPEPARTIDFVSKRMTSDEFNASLATALQETHSGNVEQMCESGVWPYLAGVARDFIDHEKFDAVADLPSDRYFWAEGVGPWTIYRFTPTGGRAVEARSFGNLSVHGWQHARQLAVAERGPFRLVPTEMVKALERGQ